MNKNYFEFQFVIGRGGFGKVWQVIMKKKEAKKIQDELMSIKKKNDIYIQKKQKEEENIKNYNLKINKSNEVKEQEFNKLNNDIGKLT